MRLTVRGNGDDQIIVRGKGIELELDAFDDRYDERVAMLAFSDGTLISGRYDPSGYWRFDVLVSGSARTKKQDGIEEIEDYTDRIQIEGDIRWVLCGWQHALAKDVPRYV